MGVRRYLVTGAASGIGRSVAELAAAEGAALCLVDISADALEKVAHELRTGGAQVATVVADLTSTDEAERVVQECVDALGGIDVLVSNAGAPVLYFLKDLSVEEFDRAIALNVRATWALGRAAHPFLSQSRGNIVATGSTCGHHPAPPQGAYSVAKAGLLMLVRQMALEWGPDGIRCNSVSPGPTMTGLTEGVFNDLSDPKQRAVREMREARLPLRKLGTPSEVAEAIMFLASSKASQITGVDILVDGGMSTVLMPSAGVSTGQPAQ
ncbi:SDR family oxidoreductase [Rhodococcus sp. 14C212]|uniref:SDR family oxidoreductase n=1 Tax=Rhodococcus sp. 14C212 TaxID=2711209 RepID=UPI0013E9C91E|nr:SDR family oxidoreductase [Rhodococcus sp. 14C212]